MRNLRPSHRNRGFGIIEMFATLVLIVVFFLVASRLFTSTMRQLSGVPKTANEMAAIEQIRGLMTRDVWNATDIRQPSDDLLLMLDSRGQLVTWQKLPEDRVSRTSGNDVNIWGNAPKLKLSISDAGVVMQQKDRAWNFASPLKINGRKS